MDDIISIHDGARPFIDSTFISDLISNAKKYGGSVPVLSLKNALIRDTIPTSTRNTKQNYSTNRENYKITQTPQIFNLHEIETSYRSLYDLISKEENKEAILANIFDDLSVYEQFKKPKNQLTILFAENIILKLQHLWIIICLHLFMIFYKYRMKQLKKDIRTLTRLKLRSFLH